MPELDSVLAEELDALRREDRYRSLRRVDAGPGPETVVDGRPLLVFGSNNYLGLAEHPEVRRAAREAAETWGAGATGSRLTTGNAVIVEALEAGLAELKGTEAALVFPTGYQAALGTVPALVGRGDLVLSDALNHACLIDACRLSRAEVRIYRHGDAEHAAVLLADRDRFRRCLVVTDGVFSMDGDLAPLPALRRLCDEGDAWLMVDDAHGTGVLGETGSGIAEHFGLRGRMEVQMGTLSKALGAQGGFIAGSRVLIDLLRNRGRSWIFSTGLSPILAAAGLAAVSVLRGDPGLPRRLRRNQEWLRNRLRTLGLPLPEDPTPILPVVLGDSGAALEAAAWLEAAGLWVPAIRPPTVPEGTARLRVSVLATHRPEDLERLSEAVAALPLRHDERTNA